MRSFFSAVCLLFLALGAPAEVNAQQPRATVLSINASGLSEAPPDQATITLGVTTRSNTAAAAVSNNATNMDALVGALRRGGVAASDIQTARVSLYPQYADEDDDRETVIGYEASNTVRVRVRQIQNTGRVIQAAVDAGGNTLNGVTFSHQNPQAQLDLARRAALAEARRLAGVYANELGVETVHMISVTEAGAARPGSEQLELTATLTTAGLLNELPQIIPGEIETRMNLSVSFELR
jgi:uncharacterized protein